MTPTWPVFKKGTRFARAFWNDTSGVILPYVRHGHADARSPEWMRLAVRLKNPRAILWVQPHECDAPTAPDRSDKRPHADCSSSISKALLVEALDYALGDARPDTSRVFILGLDLKEIGLNGAGTTHAP